MRNIHNLEACQGNSYSDALCSRSGLRPLLLANTSVEWKRFAGPAIVVGGTRNRQLKSTSGAWPGIRTRYRTQATNLGDSSLHMRRLDNSLPIISRTYQAFEQRCEAERCLSKLTSYSNGQASWRHSAICLHHLSTPF